MVIWRLATVLMVGFWRKSRIVSGCFLRARACGPHRDRSALLSLPTGGRRRSGDVDDIVSPCARARVAAEALYSRKTIIIIINFNKRHLRRLSSLRRQLLVPRVPPRFYKHKSRFRARVCVWRAAGRLCATRACSREFTIPKIRWRLESIVLHGYTRLQHGFVRGHLKQPMRHQHNTTHKAQEPFDTVAVASLASVFHKTDGLICTTRPTTTHEWQQHFSRAC